MSNTVVQITGEPLMVANDDRPSHKQTLARLFAQNLHRARLARGWSQSDLAREAGLQRDVISKYSRGAYMPSADSLLKLMAALKVERDQLIPDSPVLLEDDDPVISLNPVPGRPNLYRLKLDVVVDIDTGTKILALVRGNEAAQR